MTESEPATDQAIERGATAPASVTGLHRELRDLFVDLPPPRALVSALELVCAFFGATNGVLHGRLGVQLLSEEWGAEGFELNEALHEAVNEAMCLAMENDRARCIRLSSKGGKSCAVFAAVLYEDGAEQTGATAIVLQDCDRERALHVLSSFEGISGYLSLLIGKSSVALEEDAHASEKTAVEARAKLVREADDPVRLAFGMAAQIKNRYGLDQISIGFVCGQRVRLVAVCGLDEVRASNPGIKLIQSAMEECLDRESQVICHGNLVMEGGDTEDDYRLHLQWSKRVGGESVASFPLEFEDETVAIISVRHSSPGVLSPESISQLAKDMAVYGPLVPLANLASRSVAAHSADSIRKTLLRVFGRGWRSIIAAGLTVLVGSWLFLGQVPYQVSVRGRVTAAEWLTVPCARGGNLERVHVKPGDRVKAGQLLAEFDSRDQVLLRADLVAQMATVTALRDKALGGHDPTQMRVLTAQLGSLKAEFTIVERQIQRSNIVAPKAGTIIEGDLRSRVGTQIGLGEDLFQIAIDGSVRVMLDIPENRLLDSQEMTGAWFAPVARPDLPVELLGLSISPVSSFREGKNVFSAETVLGSKGHGLLLGMEGIANLEIGHRPPWWVLTHRVHDWLCLNFWW